MGWPALNPTPVPELGYPTPQEDACGWEVLFGRGATVVELATRGQMRRRTSVAEAALRLYAAESAYRQALRDWQLVEAEQATAESRPAS